MIHQVNRKKETCFQNNITMLHTNICSLIKKIKRFNVLYTKY